MGAAPRAAADVEHRNPGREVRNYKGRGMLRGPGGVGADHRIVVAVRVHIVVVRLLRTHSETLPLRSGKRTEPSYLAGAAGPPLAVSSRAATVASTLAPKHADTASPFGDAEHIGVSTPFSTQSEVEAAAKAVAEQIASAYAEIEGVATGNTKLRAGTAVSPGRLKKPFDGKYFLTTTRHSSYSLNG